MSQQTFSAETSPLEWLVQESKVDQDFGYCVLNTFNSILSSLANEYVMLPDEAKEKRKSQMEQALTLIQKKFDKHKLESLPPTDAEKVVQARLKPASIRMEMMAVERFAQELAKQPYYPASLLSDCEIKMATGGEDEMKAFIEEGWEVGAIVPLSTRQGEMMHVFHVCMDNQGGLYDRSDAIKTETLLTASVVRKQMMDGTIEKNIKEMLKTTNGKNLLLIRKKR